MSSSYLALVGNAKDEARNFDEFIARVKDDSNTQAIITAVNEKTQKWGITCGLTGPKKKSDTVAGLSEKELAWKKFFEDHSFQDTETQRNFADGFSIIEGIDLSRFIRVIKPAKDRFPKYVSIVPTANRNGHSYKIGQPIFSFSSGTTFYSQNGGSGNQMSSAIDTFRLSTREEIEMLILSILYRMSSAAENLFYGLILDPDIREDS